MITIRIIRSGLPKNRDETTLYYDCNGGRFARGNVIVLVARQIRMFVLIMLSHTFITNENMVALLWGDDVDGGPVDERNSLSSLVMAAKPALIALGFRLEVWHRVGFRIHETGG